MSSIRNKLVLFVSLLLILAVAAASVANFYMLRKELLVETGERLKKDAVVYAGDLGRWMEVRVAEVGMLANSPLLVENNRDRVIPYLASEIKGPVKYFV